VRNNKIAISLIVLICACLIGVFFFKDFFLTQTSDDYRKINDMESAYNADAKIAQALEQISKSQDKAAVITGDNRDERQIALTFDGLTDSTSIQRILDLLKRYNAKATFFVDGVQTAEDPQTVVSIKNQGQRIENYTLSGMISMEKLPVAELVSDFCRAQRIIKVTTDQESNLLKCNSTVYTDQLLQAARACGFNSVVESDVFVDIKQISSSQAADDFVKHIKQGSIISIDLKANVDLIVNEPGKTDLRPAIDKQPGLKQLPALEDLGDQGLVNAVERLLIALNKANYTTADVEDFSKQSSITKAITANLPQNSSFDNSENTMYSLTKLAAALKEQLIALFSIKTVYAAEAIDNRAQEIKVISTTEPALSYTFAGLANEAAVNDVLGRLHNIGIKGTFFVFEIEMQRYPETLRKIIDSGHEIGIAIRPKEGETLDETRSSIMRCDKLLREKFGVATNLVKQPWGAVSATTKQAVFSLGGKLIGQSVNVVQSKHKDYTAADQVMGEIFGKYAISLARGQIVHFRMDYYTNNKLLGDLIETIKQRKVDNIAYAASYDNPANNWENDSQYTIKPIGQILNNKKFVYQYPVYLADVPEHLRYDGPSPNINQRNFLAEASKRYIGNKDVTNEDRIIGFSKMDIRRLDTSGVIQTEDNVIFLTFDDWGTDAAVNKLLYVLRKHQAVGSFFILTNHVLNNSNLLRAIAMEGHEISSHSDQHKPMAVRDPKTGRQVKTQTKEEYLQDLATSYRKLRAVTGDIIINDKPALTRFFRPPTLAISRMGFKTLFDTGYEYIISGSSIGDYEAESVAQLVRIIKDNIYTKKGEVKKGTILVLHMGDTSPYTSIAIDILLTANAAKDDSDPSKFKVGRFSDYLTDGYSQRKPKNG